MKREVFAKPETDQFVARCESNTTVFEVTYDEIKLSDVTVSFKRDGESVASIYNDYNTSKTMAHIYAPGETDFSSHEVPKKFVEEVLNHAEAHDLVENPERVYGYRVRILE